MPSMNINQPTKQKEYHDLQDIQWNDMYKRLISYTEKHGDCLVPKYYKEDPKLGLWVGYQRAYYKHGKIPTDRLLKLQSIGFIFDYRSMAIEYSWNRMFSRLLLYKQKHGNCAVPQNYEEDQKLGTWVNYQRMVYKSGKLPKERIDKLTSIGFLFSIAKENNEAKWNYMLNRLLAYKKEHGNCNVSQKYKEDKALGYWVDHQRQFYKNNNLSIDRTNKLKSIGFVFSRRQGTNKKQTINKNEALEKNMMVNVNTIPVLPTMTMKAEITSNDRKKEDDEERKCHHNYILAEPRPPLQTSSNIVIGRSNRNGGNSSLLAYGEKEEKDAAGIPNRYNTNCNALGSSLRINEKQSINKHRANQKNNMVYCNTIPILPKPTMTTTAGIIIDERKEEDDKEIKNYHKYFCNEQIYPLHTSGSNDIGRSVSNCDNSNDGLFADAEKDDVVFATSSNFISRSSSSYLSSTATTNANSVTYSIDNDSIFADAEDDVDWTYSTCM